MRKLKNIIIMACLSLALSTVVFNLQVYAQETKEDTYTITFRPGNVGYFAVSKNPQGDRNEMAKEVASRLYGAYPYEVTKHGAIKVEVKENQQIPAAPTYIQPEEGYFVKDSSSWAPQGTATRNEDYVVDYGKLINGVEYTVEYVDQASKESIAPVYIAQANEGEERSITAPAVIVLSDAAVYRLVSQATQTILLDKDAAKNVITFEYVADPTATVVDEVLIDGEGRIITTTDTVTTVIPAEAAPAAVEGAVQAVAPAQGAEGEQELVAVEEEEVPLNNVQLEPEGNGEDLVQISEEEVPLSSMEQQKPNMALIGATVFSAAAALVAVMWLMKKRKRSTVIENKKED